MFFISFSHSNWKKELTEENIKFNYLFPPKIDASVTMMTVEEKPDITYAEVGGAKEQIEQVREVVEVPLLHVRFFFFLFLK